jgi:hypothetical protein
MTDIYKDMQARSLNALHIDGINAALKHLYDVDKLGASYINRGFIVLAAFDEEYARIWWDAENEMWLVDVLLGKSDDAISVS